MLRRKINSTIEAFYRKRKAGGYHTEPSALSVVQSIVHLALVILLATHSLLSGSLLLSITGILLNAVLILILISFITVRVKVYDDEVRCLYGPFTYSIKKGEIEQVEIIEPHNYLGYGIMVRRDKHGWLLKFIKGPGPGMLIRKKNGIFRSVFISSKDPVLLLQKIAMKMC